MSVTLEEIAKAAGVSVSTASRALHNSKYAINDETRQRIVQLSKEMGYSPNLSARGLRGKSTYVIGIVVENVSDPFSSKIVRGIIDQLKLVGYSSIIVNTDYDPLAEKDAVATLVSNQTDGIVFVYSSIHSDQNFLEITNNQPYVSIARIQPPGENTIGLDDYYGAQLAVNHLLKLGRQRIAFISGPEFWWSSRERLAGYLDALKLRSYSSTTDYIKQGDWEIDSGRRAAQELLALAEPPDAIFAANDLMALGAIYAIQDAGFEVPKDVAVVGHDDREFAQVMRPALSTVRLPCYELGQAAAQMIIKRLDNDEPVPALLIRGELIVRDSCGGVGLLPTAARSETQVGRDVVVLRQSGNLRFRSPNISDVRIEDGFWGSRQEINRKVTIPAIYEQLEDRGYVEALKHTWFPGMPYQPRLFGEAELAQWMEAASFSLATRPDTNLTKLLNQLIDLLVQAQHPDGYLNAYYTVVEPGRRFTNLRDNYELYSAGHLLEAANAHHQVTGEYRFLNVALRFADLIGSVFGAGEHQKHGYPGYPEIELALIDHFRLTGDRRYLELSRYFINQRGQKPYYFDKEARDRGDNVNKFAKQTYEFVQSHLPVREQTEAVGHAARAVNLYAAMTDLGIELEDETLIEAVQHLFESVCYRRMYITGGIGSSLETEGFTFDYDLPNDTAYASTTAAIGLWHWMHRMLHIDCDGKYADVMERVLYNGILSGMSLEGLRFFNGNVLKVERGNKEHLEHPYHRQEWHVEHTCAPNVSRLLASIGQFIYAQSETELIVHHYIQGSGVLHIAGQPITVSQETAYPWEGNVAVRLELATDLQFALKLRLPGWCQEYSLMVNNEVVSAEVERGYLSVLRTWKSGDEILLEMDMPVRRIHAHPKVIANRGRIALQRGAIVYCLEETDNGDNLDSIVLPNEAVFESTYEPDLLGGVVTIKTDGLREGSNEVDDEHAAYFSSPLLLRPFMLKAVPYFAWDNRTSGDMLVWIREAST